MKAFDFTGISLFVVILVSWQNLVMVSKASVTAKQIFARIELKGLNCTPFLHSAMCPENLQLKLLENA